MLSNLLYERLSFVKNARENVPITTPAIRLFSTKALHPHHCSYGEQHAHAPGAARLAHQAEDPFQPGAAHPQRGARYTPGDKVERSANTEREAHPCLA